MSEVGLVVSPFTKSVALVTTMLAECALGAFASTTTNATAALCSILLAGFILGVSVHVFGCGFLWRSAADCKRTDKGATNAITTTVPIDYQPMEGDATAIDTVTNMLYMNCFGVNAASLTQYLVVLDGATNTTEAIPFGYLQNIAVNPVTNTVYDVQTSDEVMLVIDGAPASSGPSTARLINISTRAQVGTGGNILIPGFVIGGSGTETLLIRADGPALTQFGVSGVLAQPSLTVFNNAGVAIASNTGWGTNPNPAQIASVAAQVGAFALPSGSADCALIANLGPGSYTVQVSGVGNTTGVALAEVYEVATSGTRLVNISTRAQVGTGGNILIPGFVIAGSGTETLLVRGDVPSLTQFGVSGALAQPSLSLFDNTGTMFASNTGWTSADVGLIAAFNAAVGTFQLPLGSADSAQAVSLPPGAYTMQISGVNSTTGVALAEIYEVP